jgi:hypothetical protein
MLQLMEYCIETGLITTQLEFCKAINFNVTNIKQIRSGKQSFTHVHCHAACTVFGINMNWLYGFESKMFRAKTKQKTET